MKKLPTNIQQYFESLEHGFEDLLPVARVQNRRFLLLLYGALQSEPRVTEADLVHLRVLLRLADSILFPDINDAKDLCEAEVFLCRAMPQIDDKHLCNALRWAFYLLARHGKITVNLEEVTIWVRIWSNAQSFQVREQMFLNDVIRWMKEQSFSPRSIYGAIKEYQKFSEWMSVNDILSIGQIGNDKIHEYLLSRASRQSNTSKQRILGNLRAFFYYFKAELEPSYTVPDFTVYAPKPLIIGISANNQEIKLLCLALKNKQFTPKSGLMLALVIAYGLPLKVLPLLRLSDKEGELVYEERLPSRKGSKVTVLRLNLNETWLSELWEAYLFRRMSPVDHDYLFVSILSCKKRRPVSVAYCQSQVQAAVKSVLGYAIPVNHLERGALKQLACHHKLSHFMDLTAKIPKSPLTRMMYWLNQQRQVS